MLTALLGPRPGSQRVYAFAQGPIHLDDPNRPASGKIHQGCRLEEDFYNVFTHDGRITLVVDKNHAGFQTAQEIAELVNDSQRYFRTGETSGSYLAKALDQVNIEVKIPEHYRDDPVAFVSQILDQRILNPQTDARVVINPRSGSVIIGADVEIGAVAVTHKNVIVETGGGPASQFVPLDAAKNSAKLKTLVETLNAVKVPTADIIEIIKGLERNGKLYGRLIVE
jgi:flagellar P-ring protein precursor FlgI